MTSLVLRDWLTTNSDPLEPFRILAETLPQLVWTAHPNGELEFVNRRWIEYTGFDSDDAQSGAWKKLIHPEDFLDASAHWEHSLKHFTPLETQNRFLGRNGEYRWFLIRAEPLLDSNGQPVMWFGTCTDIHNERSEQHRLRDRCQTIVENANDGVLEVSLYGTIQFANRRMAELLGCPVDELVGRSALDFLFEEEQRRARIRLEARREGHGERYEARWRRADGSEIWMHTASTPKYDANGEIIGSFGIFTDLTSLRHSQSLLQVSEQRFKTSIDNLIDCFAILSSIRDDAGQIVDFKFEYLNPNACKVHRMTFEEQIGHGLLELMPVHRDNGLFDAYKSVVETGEPYTDEHQHIEELESGHKISHWFEIRVTRMDDGFVASWRDITPRKTAQLKLEAMIEPYRNLAESLPQLVWVSDYAGNITYYNSKVENYSGIMKDKDGTWKWQPVLHPDDHSVTIQAWQAALSTGIIYECEHRISMNDGSYRWHLSRAIPMGEDYTRQWFGTATDIHAIKLAERNAREHHSALTLSEGRFRAAVDAVGGLLWTNSSEGLMHGEQPGWAAFTGQRYDEYQGYGWAKAVHPEDVQPSIESWKKAVAHQSTYIFEHRLLRHDGIYRFFAIRAVPVLNEDGTIREWVGVHVDITEQREAEQALRVSEEKFRLIADTMPQIVWSTRPDGYHDYFNKRWYEYTGMPLPDEPGGEYDPNESGQGWNWKEYLHPDDYEPSVQRWQESLRTGELYTIEYRFRRTDGVYRWFIGRALPLKDAHGYITRWFGTCTDVEDVKAAENALRDADRRKDNFLATLAHELRNPLAPIRSATELLKLTSIHDPVIDEIRDAIDRQVTHMVRLIDDLLDISRITNGKLQLRHEPVILQQVLQSAIETSMPLITAGQHQLNIQTVKEPIPLVGDPVRLAQIFSNLLTNAAKYSEPNGAISVIVTRLDHEVCVIFRDHGIGIPPEHLPRLFEMFSQVQSAIDRSQGGLGIGLSLVRALVEHHDGTVEAHSQGLGTGSEFTVRLPIRQYDASVPTTVATPTHPTSVPTGLTSRRILVVDDSPTIARMLSMLLTTKGHDVETASNGEEALSALQSGVYDLVLMDIGMPIMNGYEAAKRARASGITIPMVALTGFGREEDKLAATQAGFNTHLIKPISSQALDQVLAQLNETPA